MRDIFSIIIVLGFSGLLIFFIGETNVTEFNQKIAHDAMILRQTQGIDLNGKTCSEAYEILKLYENKIDLEIKELDKVVYFLIYGGKMQPYIILFDKEQNCYTVSEKSDMKLVKNIRGENVLILKNSNDIILTDEEAEKITWIFE